MDKLIKYTILATIAGVILAFNMYHADYKLLVAQIGTIALVAMYIIARLNSIVIARPGSSRHCEEAPKVPTKQSQRLLRLSLRSFLAMTVENPAILFLGVCVLSFFISPHKLASWHELYKIGTWIVFGMIVATDVCKPASQPDCDAGLQTGLNIINVWLICAGIVALYGILQFFGIDFMNFKLPGGRIISTFGNATLLAGFLAMTLPVALAKAMEKDKAISYQLSAVSLVVVLLVCLILTKSRAGVLAAMVGIGIVVACNPHNPRKPASQDCDAGLRGTVLIFVLLAGAVLLFIPQARHLIFDVVLRKTARVYIWKDTLRTIAQNPIFGTGIGTFSLYFPKFASNAVFGLHPIEWEFVNHAHCEYLEILTEMGVVGLAAFLAVVIMPLTLTLSPLGRGKGEGLHLGLFAAFVTILAHNIVSVDLRYTSTGLFFWMIVAAKFTLPKGNVAAPSYGAREAAQGAATTGVRKGKASFAATGLVIILALAAIYFTVRPYALVNQVKEQEFFVDDTSKIDERIALLDVIPTQVGIQNSADSRLRGNDNTTRTAEYYFSLGVLYAKKQDFENAKRCFIETIKEDFRHAGAFNNLGNISFYEGDAGRARALFHKALMYEPDNAEYMINFASACFKVNLMGEAMSSIEKALEIDPGNKRALYLMAQMKQ